MLVGDGKGLVTSPAVGVGKVVDNRLIYGFKGGYWVSVVMTGRVHGLVRLIPEKESDGGHSRCFLL